MDSAASTPSSDPLSGAENQQHGRKVPAPNAHVPPPYWQHHRSVSYLSQASIDRPSPIVLRDRTESLSSANAALWAKAIVVEDYVLVKGNIGSLGAYVVWNCKVQTLDGGSITLRKRYSEFDRLREDLVQSFPQGKTVLPPLPPKSIIRKFQPKFLEKRRIGLSYFLNCVMLNPQYAGSAIVKAFIFPNGS